MADALVRETQRLYGLPLPGEPETGRVLPNGVGLSFGGGCFFAFGTGSNPAGATFELIKFSTD